MNPVKNHRLGLNGLKSFRMYCLHSLLALVAIGFSAVASAQAPESALTVVQQLEQALIQSMKDGAEQGLEQRRRTLAPIVDASLNYERMGRFIFGSQWLSFPDSDRNAFKQAFRKLSSTNYAARFKKYQGESFELKNSDAQGQRRARVRSHFIKKDGEAIVFDYLLLGENNEWKIVNIIVEGVSDLALKRTQYSGIFKKSGMSGVIETMATQEQQLEND
jgi:phospholipid transport system substrate-binding protein